MGKKLTHSIEGMEKDLREAIEKEADPAKKERMQKMAEVFLAAAREAEAMHAKAEADQAVIMDRVKAAAEENGFGDVMRATDALMHAEYVMTDLTMRVACAIPASALKGGEATKEWTESIGAGIGKVMNEHGIYLAATVFENAPLDKEAVDHFHLEERTGKWLADGKPIQGRETKVVEKEGEPKRRRFRTPDDENRKGNGDGGHFGNYL